MDTRCLRPQAKPSSSHSVTSQVFGSCSSVLLAPTRYQPLLHACFSFYLLLHWSHYQFHSAVFALDYFPLSSLSAWLVLLTLDTLLQPPLYCMVLLPFPTILSATLPLLPPVVFHLNTFKTFKIQNECPNTTLCNLPNIPFYITLLLID